MRGIRATGDPTYPFACRTCGDYLTTDEAQHHACSRSPVGEITDECGGCGEVLEVGVAHDCPVLGTRVVIETLSAVTEAIVDADENE